MPRSKRKKNQQQKQHVGAGFQQYDGKRGYNGIQGYWINAAEAKQKSSQRRGHNGEEWWKLLTLHGEHVEVKQYDSDGPADKPFWLFQNGDMHLGEWSINGTVSDDAEDDHPKEKGTGITYNQRGSKGLVCISEWLGGLLHGNGKSKWIESSKIWQDNRLPNSPLSMKKGRATQKFPFSFEGKYSYSSKCGQATVTLKDGSTIRGRWKDNQPVGDWWKDHITCDGHGSKKIGKVVHESIDDSDSDSDSDYDRNEEEWHRPTSINPPNLFRATRYKESQERKKRRPSLLEDDHSAAAAARKNLKAIRTRTRTLSRAKRKSHDLGEKNVQNDQVAKIPFKSEDEDEDEVQRLGIISNRKDHRENETTSKDTSNTMTCAGLGKKNAQNDQVAQFPIKSEDEDEDEVQRTEMISDRKNDGENNETTSTARSTNTISPNDAKPQRKKKGALADIADLEERLGLNLSGETNVMIRLGQLEESILGESFVSDGLCPRLHRLKEAIYGTQSD